MLKTHHLKILLFLAACSPGNGDSDKPAPDAGNGIQIVLNIEPRAFRFETTRVGGDSASQTAVVLNSGSSPSGPLLVSTANDEAGAFAIAEDHCESGLGPGETCEVVISFTPKLSGPHAGLLQITGGEGTDARTFSAMLEGEGSQVGPVAVSPASLDLGKVPVGVEHRLTLNLVNAGDVDAEITSINAADVGGFRLSNFGCQGRLLAKHTCVLRGFYQRREPGADEASVKIDYTLDGKSMAISFALRADARAGGTLTISPSDGDFGVIAAGQSLTKKFTVTASGAEGIQWPPVVPGIGGDRFPSSFVIDSQTCQGKSLRTGDSCEVVVANAPAPGAASPRSSLFIESGINQSASFMAVPLRFKVVGSLADAVIARWTFDQDAGSAVPAPGRAALTGQVSVGKLTNAPVEAEPPWVPGKTGKALRFDGETAGMFRFVRVPYTSFLLSQINENNGFSACAWLQPSKVPTPGPQSVFAIRDKPGTAPITLGLFDGKPALSRQERVLSAASTVESATVLDEAWHLLCATTDGTSSQLYADGVSVLSFPGPNILWTSDPSILIGGLPGEPNGVVTSTSPFRGLIDEVVIWSRIVEANEIQTLFQKGFPQ
ncbi:MAG: choice-of-anchor D domain-containing protein [Deltaproteobacteria bacterium]|nr:choice-of-anchor D domain-containing protein [Deltaproteobacteria bacterium]